MRDDGMLWLLLGAAAVFIIMNLNKTTTAQQPVTGTMTKVPGGWAAGSPGQVGSYGTMTFPTGPSPQAKIVGGIATDPNGQVWTLCGPGGAGGGTPGVTYWTPGYGCGGI